MVNELCVLACNFLEYLYFLLKLQNSTVKALNRIVT